MGIVGPLLRRGLTKAVTLHMQCSHVKVSSSLPSPAGCESHGWWASSLCCTPLFPALHATGLRTVKPAGIFFWLLRHNLPFSVVMCWCLCMISVILSWKDECHCEREFWSTKAVCKRGLSSQCMIMEKRELNSDRTKVSCDSAGRGTCHFVWLLERQHVLKPLQWKRCQGSDPLAGSIILPACLHQPR